MSTVESKEILGYAEMDPELAQVLQDAPKPPNLGEVDIKLIRGGEMKAKKAYNDAQPQPEGVKTHDTTVVGRDGHAIPVRIYTPETSPPSECPVQVVFHGGGWNLGSLLNEDITCRHATAELGFVCINVDYRLAPEHPFPSAVHDCIDVTKWVGASCGTSPHLPQADPGKGFIITGSSAGANMADVVAHVWRDEKLSPPLTGVFEMCPPLVDHAALPEKYRPFYLSWDQNVDVPVLPRYLALRFLDAYKGEPGSPLYHPFPHSPHGHSDLPPICVVACGLDPIRDDPLVYAKHLREETNTKVKVILYKGLPHCFWSSFPTLQRAKTFRADQAAALKWLLNGGND